MGRDNGALIRGVLRRLPCVRRRDRPIQAWVGAIR